MIIIIVVFQGMALKFKSHGFLEYTPEPNTFIVYYCPIVATRCKEMDGLVFGRTRESNCVLSGVITCISHLHLVDWAAQEFNCQSISSFSGSQEVLPIFHRQP